MQKDDILYSCDRIAGISAIPVRVYRGERQLAALQLHQMPLDPIAPYLPELLARQENVSYFITPFEQFYGCLRHKSYRILLGPVGTHRYTAQQKRDYAFALGVEPAAFERLLECMELIPFLPLENFLHLMLLLNFYFNGEKLYMDQVATYLQAPDQPLASAAEAPLRLAEPAHAAPLPHNALDYERQMLALIRAGDEQGLSAFLMTQIHGTAGLLAGGPLRQQKNLFIVSTTLACRAAVEGGLAENEAMALSDEYIQHCETLFSMDALARLQYQMVMDYAHRVAIRETSAPLSPLTAQVLLYIRQNISAPLDGGALAKRFHISRNTLCVRFKADTGQPLAHYVQQQRIQRAKDLLRHTSHPLAQIAAYLGFASQSHFHTRFRAATGFTPLAYRQSGEDRPLEKPE